MTRGGWLLLIGLTGGCAGQQPALARIPASIVDTAAVESIVQQSISSGPRRASFRWTLDEAGERFSGRGVARFEAPERIRLDLFGPRGETYLVAALVGDSIRLPPGASGGIALPSPALLWAVLGVIKPPTGARATAIAGSGGDRTLQFASPSGETWEFQLRAADLAGVRRAEQQRVAESVELARSRSGDLRSTRYRNWPAFRTLDLAWDSIGHAEPFPRSIWLGAGDAP